MTRTLRHHWPEYLMEASLLALFMLSACTFSVLIFHPDSAFAPLFGDEVSRRACMGVAMGLTAIALIYSPWGKQSGAHLNPAVTLAFLRMRKIDRVDAGYYALSQVAGAVTGVLLARLLIGSRLSEIPVRYAVTLPGIWGNLPAFFAELAIAFAMMLTVLLANNHPSLAPNTGLFAGLLITLYITFESPISGMSMNPARTLGSAFVAQEWRAVWIYLVAPTVGMQLAVSAYLHVSGRNHVGCAKLHHRNAKRCIFCEYQHAQRNKDASRSHPSF